MKIEVTTSHSFGVLTEVDLLKDKTIDDIDDVYVKYGEGEINYKDGSVQYFSEDIDDYLYDYKNPDEIRYDKCEEE